MKTKFITLALSVLISAPAVAAVTLQDGMTIQQKLADIQAAQVVIEKNKADIETITVEQNAKFEVVQQKQSEIASALNSISEILAVANAPEPEVDPVIY